MLKRSIIINADGYGFTPGITRAIEECIDFGTVKSLSANVNFPSVEALPSLVRRHPNLSVGCHLNPVVGKPVLPIHKIRSLVNQNGEFFYKEFNKKLILGHIKLEELRSELLAQVDLCRKLAGDCFSHVDCHMGKHRFPQFYPIFLEVAKYSGTNRIRTHKYKIAVLENQNRNVAFKYYLKNNIRFAMYCWNLYLRYRAKRHNLNMPDFWVNIVDTGFGSDVVSINSWISLIKNLPTGICEFVVHPGYVDEDLRRWSTYLYQREIERNILTSMHFRNCIIESEIQLAGYRNISVGKMTYLEQACSRVLH